MLSPCAVEYQQLLAYQCEFVGSIIQDTTGFSGGVGARRALPTSSDAAEHHTYQHARQGHCRDLQMDCYRRGGPVRSS